MSLYRGYEIHLEIRRSGESEPYQIKNGRSVYEFMRGLDVESAEHAYELLLDVKHRVHGVYRQRTYTGIALGSAGAVRNGARTGHNR